MPSIDHIPAISHTLTQVKNRIQASAQKVGRISNSVTLLAVSKKQPSSAIQAAYQAGQSHFGENYIQEGEAKRLELTGLDICWHFIGHIQSNKAKTISRGWDWVHTVDRSKIIDLLNQFRPDPKSPLNICIQVNIDNDPAKSGCLPGETFKLAQHVQGKPKLRLRGLMTVPSQGLTNQGQSPNTFARLKELFDTLNTQLETPMDTLSMGMSADMECAIANGATIVRVGSAIFGSRNT